MPSRIHAQTRTRNVACWQLGGRDEMHIADGCLVHEKHYVSVGLLDPSVSQGDLAIKCRRAAQDYRAHGLPF